MTNFRTPYDLSFEDKIVGGKLTMRQTLWLAAPTVYFFASIQNTSLLKSAESIIGFILIFLGLLSVAIIFGFVNVNGVHLDIYLIKKVKFKMRKTLIKNYE